MQREHISIPKLIAYVLFSVIIFALQTGTFGGMRIFGSIGVGDLAKATRAHQCFYINGRTARRPGGGGCCRLDGRHLL